MTGSGHRQGEDWSEKAASHLAEHLSVPCATVELALRDGVEGSISRDLGSTSFQVQSGALYLVDRQVPGFEPARELEHDKSRRKQRPGHSLLNIRTALQDALPPPGCALPAVFSAFDVFVGYLILDAWIGNQDRHDENWSVLVPAIGDDPVRLCSSYDQAGGLGFNLLDEKRKRRLALGGEHGIVAYAERGSAWRFENTSTQPVRTLVELAIDGIEMASADARAYWTEAVSSLEAVDPEPLFARISAMSDPARTFACELLKINGRRLRDECDRRS
ncbi:hypothetical protein CWIS_04485 [Cellulomonas sp. A375-1]|nr:hypothetical protein CWIS_04485 [Cellulomonas sp. A375-1]